jgi:hypothetical protein
MMHRMESLPLICLASLRQEMEIGVPPRDRLEVNLPGTVVDQEVETMGEVEVEVEEGEEDRPAHVAQADHQVLRVLLAPLEEEEALWP